MSHNVLLCLFLHLTRFIANLPNYGGCRDFRHMPAHFISDPFGAMPRLHEKVVYKRVNKMVLVA